MKVAIIPARGGSKRIPRKNIKEFCGKPMIAWSIEAIQTSGCFDQVLVSTDDREIAEIARYWGAKVPFFRPPELSDDHTGMRPVLDHALSWLHDQCESVELVGCALATAPFLSGRRIADAVSTLADSSLPRAFLVAEFPYPVQRGFTVSSTGSVELLMPQYQTTRSQDLPSVFHDAGQLYLIESPVPGHPIPPFFGPDSLPIPLPGYLVQDIDTQDDWQRAEIMMQVLIQQQRL